MFDLVAEEINLVLIVALPTYTLSLRVYVDLCSVSVLFVRRLN